MHGRVSKLVREEASSSPASSPASSLPHHVAYLLQGSKVVAVAHNERDGVHAEMRALAHVRREGRYRLYVTRLHANAMSRPCFHCSARLRRAPCASLRVFYTDARGEWVEDVDLDSTHVARRYRSR